MVYIFQENIKGIKHSGLFLNSKEFYREKHYIYNESSIELDGHSCVWTCVWAGVGDLPHDRTLNDYIMYVTVSYRIITEIDNAIFRLTCWRHYCKTSNYYKF